MNQIYKSDKPIHLKSQDRFNRYKFSNRISDTIIKRNSDEGLVIGLYGIWGEGKSSVLNMIEDDLKKDEGILIVNFNPWRYQDEDALILNYFKNISEALDKELNTRIERIGNFFKKYGSVTSVFNFNLSEIGKSFSDTQIEDLKSRVNDFLKESNRKIVVVIDDIDRLDKQELFSLFKLIKLTGDFSKTYYILSFDDEMVASAIGERFAEGNKNSGYNFLEKIIQVPLRIPQALSKDLLKFTFELLDEILKENEINLGTEEEQNVGFLISQNVLSRIKTPRSAIRYANSLSFLIPLLKGEVNMSDLILFEGLKLFYPRHFEYVKSSPEYFVESYNERFYHGRDNRKVEEFKTRIEELGKDLAKNEKQGAIDLLKHLFPIVKEAFENYSYVNTNWTKEKRIASSKYFNRYFIYSVPKDDISDVYFEEYIESLNAKNIKAVLEETNEIFVNVDPTEYVSKIGFYEDTLDWEAAKKIALVICANQEKFDGMQSGKFLFGLYNPKAQAAMTIGRLLKKHDNYEERLEFSRFLMSEEVPFEFSREIMRWLDVGKTEEEKVIKTLDLKTLDYLLLERALNDTNAHNTTLFEKYGNYIFTLLEIWYEKNPAELREYISKNLESNPIFVETVVDSLTTTITSSTNPNPHKIDFKQESYEYLKKYYDIERFRSFVTEDNFPGLDKEEAKFFDTGRGQTKVNALRQFLHWYELDHQLGDTTELNQIEEN
jgi:hypothetical protein